MTEAEPLTRMRKAIAKTMTASAAVPQFAVEMSLDTGSAAALRAGIEAERRPSFVDLLVASCAAALRDHPGINVSFTEDGIVHHEQINVAIALALDDGLISPVVASADRLGLEQLGAERRRLTEAAKAGTLTPEEILSATFTISNLGPLGVRRFNALVVPPQAAILAVGGLDEDRRMALNLSVDHRPIDGAPAARFLAQVRAQLEDAEWLAALRDREPAGAA
jgi:pyruvate dehydrogenase E2 component (dihydrolipoamide acetyltransferase)